MIPLPPSLYLHIPMCAKWCSYCAFYSVERKNWTGWEGKYVSRMQKEIENAKRLFGGSFSTIFVGGGNPLCLSPELLFSLLSAAGMSSETTVEMNPESLDDSFDILFSSSLVNRISMGIQSLNERTLSVLGRNSSREENIRGIKKAMRLKEKFGVRVNFDLMTCIPGETMEDARNDIDTLLSLSSPDHLSLYALTLEEGTALHREVREGNLTPMGDAEQASMLFSLWDYLQSQGFEQYEVSNFAKGGAYCQHNRRYWELLPYVGIGSHAASRIPHDGALLDVMNAQSLSSYAEGRVESGYRTLSLSRTQEMEEFLLVSLRTKWGIRKASFEERFHSSFDSLFFHEIKKLPSDEYQNDEDSFFLTNKGIMVMDSIVLALASSL